jgi:hypothetical protein
VVDGISAPAVKWEEVNSKRWNQRYCWLWPCVLKRHVWSLLGARVCCHAMANFVSEIESTVACQNKYSGNICHARNRGPNRFFTTKRRERKKEVWRNITTCCLINNTLFENKTNYKYFKRALKTQNCIDEETKSRTYSGNACYVVSFSSECCTYPSVFWNREDLNTDNHNVVFCYMGVKLVLSRWAKDIDWRCLDYVQE